jgi:hypothetical protein
MLRDGWLFLSLLSNILDGGIPTVLALVNRVGCSDAMVGEVDCSECSEKVEDRIDMVDIEMTGTVLVLSGLVNIDS